MKRIISLFLIMVLCVSMVTISAAAEQVESEPQNVLHFDAKTAIHWKTPYEKVYCHIWEYGGKPFFNWQSRKEKCTDEDQDGIWTYNLDDNGIVLEDDKTYACIFSNERGYQTYNLIFDKTVLPDTAYCTGEYFDSPEGINYYETYWRNQGKGLYDFGPELYITSLGNVVGTCVVKTNTTQELFEDFLPRIDNARRYSGKTDQQIVDDIAVRIELTKENIADSLRNTGIYVEWSWYDSPAETGEYQPLLGDADGDTYLTVMDATTIQMCKAELLVLCDEAVRYSDFDNDKEVTVLDATQIQLELASL